MARRNDIMDDNYREYKRLFKNFRSEHPELWNYGTTFVPYGYQEIEIIIPKKGKLIYNSIGVGGNKIRWIDGPYDEFEIKRQEFYERTQMYGRFRCRLSEYIDISNTTQAKVAEKTGVSRKSICQYLNGLRMPKVSTMKMIAEILGIDI